jgi:hypothetical protein
VCVACGAGGAKDVVPETHDVHVAAATAEGSYVHVARRTLGFVALAGEQGLGTEAASRVVDALADSMDVCATDLGRKGRLVDGAIRLRGSIDANGAVALNQVTVAPGDAVAANALLCVIAPLKLKSFGPRPADEADAGARTIAIDASWGPAGAR